MNLRTKTMYILAGVMAITLLLLVTVGREFWLHRYASLEEYYVRLNMERVESALDKEKEAQINNCRDWSAWDDTYNYLIDKNQGYYTSNVAVSSFMENQFDFMVITDINGQAVIAEQFDKENKRLIPLSSSIRNLITSGNELLNLHDINAHYNGILLLPEGPALVSSLPVITSNYEGPVHGTMLVGRYINSIYIDELADLTHTKIKIITVDNQKNTGFPAKLSSQLETYSQLTLIEPQSSTETSGYKVLKDINHKPALIMQVSIPRMVYQQGVESFWYFVGSWAFCALGIFLIITKLLSSAVLKRIETLNQEVTKIGNDGDVETRVAVTGFDEVASLGQAINSMLGTIEGSHWQAIEQEKEYRRLFNDNITANFVCDQQGRVTLCNQAFVTMFNFGSIVTASSVPISTLFNSQREYEEYKEIFKSYGYAQDIEIAMHTYDGLPIVVIGNLFADLNVEGEVQRVTGFLFNITERKLAEERLLYLGQHDVNTGLYNRSYFESVLGKVEEQHLHPLTIITGDIDGLKLVNDTLGFDAGDALLQETARILRTCAGENSVIARMGGDEFAILLYPEKAVKSLKIVEKIRKMVADYNAANPDLPLSLSLGTSRVGGSSVKATELFREADNYMYREKLHRSRSGRSSLVAALTSTLEARDYITEGHADRLQLLVEVMARSMNLADHRITDLKLFAQFHDIGKVGIPDHILNKPGKLNEEEWAEMQRHSEIGYRIAQAAPELHHISDWILKHHEWWNGQGYPLGISGLEIPLESRMLAIADAFDAMTNDRPYRSAMTNNEALQLIAKHAGQQFDPELAERFLAIMSIKNKEIAANN